MWHIAVDVGILFDKPGMLDVSIKEMSSIILNWYHLLFKSSLICGKKSERE